MNGERPRLSVQQDYNMAASTLYHRFVGDTGFGIRDAMEAIKDADLNLRRAPKKSIGEVVDGTVRRYVATVNRR